MGTGLDPNNIKEGDDVYFECLVQANPKIHKLTWFHKVSFFLILLHTNMAILVIKKKG